MATGEECRPEPRTASLRIGKVLTSIIPDRDPKQEQD